MADDKHFKTLMEYLRALRREGATFVNWLPDYEVQNGKQTGRLTITIEVREKI